MKIVSVTASVHKVEVPLPFTENRTTSWGFVFCEVGTDDGITGYGLTGKMLPFAVADTLRRDVGRLVKGMDPRDTEAIHHAVWRKLNMRCQTGVIVHALSALDIALWDIAGKAAGRTVAQLLGGFSTRADTYCTFGVPDYDIDQLTAAARHSADQGHPLLKMVVGVAKGGWREDLKRLRAVRDAIGSERSLAMDANYCMNGVEARALCQAAEELDIAFFEEPLLQNDARGLAELRRQTRIPIAAGQMEGHRWRYRELIEHRSVDILQPNCCYGGGYTDTRKVAHAAQMFNLPLAVGGGWPTFNLHLMAGLSNGGPVELHAITTAVCDLLFPGAATFDGLCLKVPEAPGLGVEPNHAFLKDTLQQP
ncbi:D-mannonate dehydratase [Ancylobacter aquaticus]|uniref:D-mannonate dehydratase n=1 Tax=Ancylobacter aquaticus TaxID=100 RepID=A0A4V2PJY8_ANCAQ|nr:mandelate racemase/muconate lactonizing enzyme family protein [Ancylobacter aquaticus]TCK30396.1 D-mannonate dehydratase [Ancylobacter aquaticus]